MVVLEQNKDDVIFPVHRAILMSSSPVFQAMFENDMQEKKNSEVRIEDIPSDAVKLMLDYIYGGVLPTNTFVSPTSLQNNSSSSSLSISSLNNSSNNNNNNNNNNNQDVVIHPISDNEQKSNSPILVSSNNNNMNNHNNNNNGKNNNNSKQNQNDTARMLSVGMALLCLSDKYRMNDLKHHCEYALHQLLNIDSCLHLLLASNRYNAKRLRSVSLNYVSAHFQALSQSQNFKEFGDCNPSLLQEVLSNVTKEVQSRPQKRLRLAINPNNSQNNGNNPHKF